MSAWRSLSVGSKLGAAALAGVLLSGAFITPAPAQGFLESLFGSRRAPAPPSLPLTNPVEELIRAMQGEPAPLREAGPARAYCVRTCDGYHFPVQAQGNSSPAEMCNAFCPASTTKIFFGNGIENSSSNGARYTEMPNAFGYRERVVSGCSCNGKSSFGLAQLDVNRDQTLRPGDIVASKAGLTVYSRSRNATAEFTPIAVYGGFSKSYRDKLSELKIMETPAEATTAAAPASASTEVTGSTPDDRRRAQLN